MKEGNQTEIERTEIKDKSMISLQEQRWLPALLSRQRGCPLRKHLMDMHFNAEYFPLGNNALLP
jgi:hypothetical protein